MAFSLQQRPELVDRLRSETFDLVVVGGGITGAGIARDAALRGLRVALCERGDFACGTSSRSSKLIHGGLRYLEMGDIALVFEAVRERQRLLRLAPHLARPQSFLVPVIEGSRRSVFILDVGLTIYDMLAAFSGVLRHRALRQKAVRRMEPLLKPEKLSGGVRYYDAMTDDGRLVLANLRGALQAGAVPVSRLSFVAPVLADGQVSAVRLRDEWKGEDLLVKTHGLVLATGPWTDEATARWKGQETPATLRPSKGVHVVVPRARLPLSHAVTMNASDGRVVFALPWPDATILGTTDTPYDGDLAEPPTTQDDAEYLITCANAHFDPIGGPLALPDVISTWAGIRPLVANEPGQSSYKTSREHVILSDPKGMVSVAGGKLTTYRLMAAETVDAATRLLAPARIAELKPCSTAHLPLPGAENLPTRLNPVETAVSLLASTEKLDEAVARHLVWQYGSDAQAVVALARQTADGMDRVLPDLPLIWGELHWIVQEEMALTVIDLAVRRTQLYYLAGERLLGLRDELARRLCAWSGQAAGAAGPLAEEVVHYVAAHRVQPSEAADAA